MGFPGTWMTESESVVYRVVPKCACSTIGQIMFYADHGRFFDGDIHDAQAGMHKWSMEASQPIIERAAKGHKVYTPTLTGLGMGWWLLWRLWNETPSNGETHVQSSADHQNR